ncbi:major facilitator superfamily transporter [Diplocarpon rosae]|nr:major facilitator superfamily transporter [Diplocarpon rosae]
MPGAEQMASRKGTPPFPVRQMTILALCRICEPIAFMSIFPYVYFMIEDFHVTQNSAQISVYAGMVTSAFAFAEFSSGVVWGKLSDRIGRKPVLLTGLAGTALSMLIFGFAPSLPIALLARALGGLLNGNIGVLQTTVAEMVTVKEHQPRAYTIMPFKCRRDPGLEAGRWILGKVTRCAESKSSRGEKVADLDEAASLLSQDEQPPGYRTTEGSPKLPSTPAAEPQEALDLNAPTATPHVLTPRAPKPAASKAFTRQVVMNIVGYGILAYHTMTFDAMLPTMLSTTAPDGGRDLWRLPFKFVGGYGLDTKAIGVILSVQGLYSMLATLFLFPLIVRRLGALGLFRLIAVTYPVLYLTTPYLVLLPAALRTPGIYAVVIWKCTFSTMAYPANAILLTNSAPSLLMLGTINGVAASTASLSRAVGPTVSGFLFSAGLQLGYSGLAWWCSALIAAGGAILSLRMTDAGGRMNVDEKTSPEAGQNDELELGFEDHILALDQALTAVETERDPDDA